LAWTFHFHYALLFFLGALLAWCIERRWPRQAEELTFPVASGWIAGESLMGVGLVLWEHAGDLAHRLIGRCADGQRASVGSATGKNREGDRGASHIRRR